MHILEVAPMNLFPFFFIFAAFLCFKVKVTICLCVPHSETSRNVMNMRILINGSNKLFKINSNDNLNDIVEVSIKFSAYLS